MERAVQQARSQRRSHHPQRETNTDCSRTGLYSLVSGKCNVAPTSWRGLCG
ncbi:hypothetical protein EYF80_062450 [Liparis tanakae]|uniref:Uncharacterized protein n=1 Tax=Liparis tanakae TaxID=230148 RepID=A0A4Z2EEV0_9TELE|nr:hypothetical protein EYF80_062450 [Liparis tanakae]